MPLLHKKEFERLSVPEEVTSDSEVFFLSSTKEVFLDYDEYFERMMLLNSSIWTCSVTGKPGLTYEEACQSEKDAMEQIENFPDYLELPILFLVHTFTCRSRIDDLVNDIFVFMKDRYFVNEELFYHLPGKRKKYVRVLKVVYHEAGSNNKEEEDDDVVCLSSPIKGRTRTPQQKGKLQKSTGSTVSKRDGKISSGHDDASKKKSATPQAPAPECYRYRLQVIDKEEDSDSDSSSSFSNSSNDSNNEIYEDVKCSEICREKSAATKPRIKLFIKHCTELEQGQFVVKKQYISDLLLDNIKWKEMFAGPPPRFQLTRRVIKPETLKTIESKKSSGKITNNLAKTVKSKTATKNVINDDSIAGSSVSTTSSPIKAGTTGLSRKSNSKATQRRKMMMFWKECLSMMKRIKRCV